LAAIAIVAYGSIRAKADNAAGQNAVNSAYKKISTYNAEKSVAAPVSYGSITGAPQTQTYSFPNEHFTDISGDKPMSVAVRAYAGNVIYNDSVDYSLCGANGTVVAPTNYVGITVPSGVKLGYWDNILGSLNTNLSVGTISGNYPSGSSFPVACFKVGVAEMVAGYIKAYVAENAGTYPTTLADVNTNAHNVAGAALSAGVAITNAALTSGNGLNNVQYSYVSGNTGARIVYWDYATGATSTLTNGGTSIYLGTAVWNSTFTNPT